jgi:hypothetical protein
MKFQISRLKTKHMHWKALRLLFETGNKYGSFILFPFLICMKYLMGYPKTGEKEEGRRHPT